MEAKKVPQVLLNSGHKMPMIGFGTAAIPNPSDEELVSICVEAIKSGYRHFDTAAVYQTEKPLGQAVSQALKLGLIKSRDELFITSKLWCNNTHPDLVLPALQDTLKRLGLEYVDLYLVHLPVRLKPETEGYFFPKEDLLEFDMENTWKAMEECSKLGLAKSIGVSNFSCHKLSKLLQRATIPPAVNQVEMNVSWQQEKMLRFCNDNGIHVSTWSSLGAPGTLYYGTNAVMESQVLKNIANAKGKSISQVALRWIHEQGATAIVKSFDKERSIQNLGMFGLKINEDDLEVIRKIPQKRMYLGEMFVSPNGPYKSVEELWDGEDEA